MRLFIHELNKLKRSIIVWSVSLCTILTLYMTFFPSIGQKGLNEVFEAEIKAMPDFFVKALNLSIVDFSVYSNYFAYVFQFLLMAIAIYALIVGSSILLKEENEKTIEFLYANPISRNEIVTSKLFAGLTGLLMVNAFTLIITFIIGYILGESKFELDLLTIYGYSMITVFVYYAIGMLFSSILRSSGVVTTSLGVFFLTYIISILSDLVDKLKFLSWASPFNYIIPMDILQKDIDMTKIVILIVIFVVSIIGSYIFYNKKQLYI